MHFRQSMPQALANLIRIQCGAVSVEQARAHGLCRSALRRLSAQWHKLADGLYIVGEVTWHAFAWAALLRGGASASLGGGAACYLHGLIQREPDSITIWCDSPKVALEHSGFRAQFKRAPRRARGEMPRTNVEESLCDYASETNPLNLIKAVTRAFGQRKTTPARVRDTLARRSRVAQRQLLIALTDHSNTGIHSVLEWQFNVLVAKPHGLAELSRQVKLTHSSRVDVWFDDFGVIVELDGRQFHDADRDARRDNEHALRLGAVTLRFTWRQAIHEACEVARVIERALRIRGWLDGIRACPDCRLVR